MEDEVRDNKGVVGGRSGVRPESGQEASQEASQEVRAAAARIERLRGLRNRPKREQGLGAGLGRVAKDASESRRKLGSAADAWEAVAPERLREACGLESFSRGVLKVTAPDAGTRSELERWLRGGGLAELAAATKAPLRRVASRIGGVDEAGGGRSGRDRSGRDRSGRDRGRNRY